MAKQQHTVRNIDGVTHFVPKSQKQTLISQQSLIRTTFILGLVLLIGAIILIVSRFQAPPNLEKADGIKQVLSKHMIVPNEQPVIATVTDKSALKTPFLQESDNGDKIIIYEKARKVVIYRPSIDRIVDIGPVDLNNIPKTQ